MENVLKKEGKSLFMGEEKNDGKCFEKGRKESFYG